MKLIFDAIQLNQLFGQELHNKRKLHHLSTHELSTRLQNTYNISVSAMTISRVERGSVVSSDKLFALARFLDINLNDFINYLPAPDEETE
ncbi:helix-turn-helix domain-containing protein [Paucilactobacillus kaifaensis]|uniref:helix-turn-helix domain-containing protein n=1 Tax=Paucilactobacillus kaifaensis TaxID=2559921 RepID=UPI0010F8D46C|nr:helix-turn-helix transcriptional regulator [Paucilactobacillus kaifaensis]